MEYRLALRELKKHLVILFAAVVSLASCGGGHSSSSPTTVKGNEMPLEYARLLKIAEYPQYTEVNVINPWDTLKILHKYILIPRDTELPGNLPAGTVVRIPLENSLVYSSVHGSLIKELNSIGAVGGVCNSEYFKDSDYVRLIKEGKIADCGSGMTPDIERIIKLSPDAIFLSPYYNNDKYAKVGELGIPVIECADYMEPSALGQAEWIRFYGLLFDKKELAENIFESIESEYTSLRDLALSTKNRPKVLTDQRYGQVWNVPGGNSKTAMLIADAGGNYAFSGYKDEINVPLAPERVLAEAHDADVWFIKYNQARDKSLRELAKDDPVNSRFDAYRNSNVYGCNTQFKDFYEETPFHPERYLKDLILAIHPEVMEKSDSLRYFSKLK